jgi:hypothetical protein
VTGARRSGRKNNSGHRGGSNRERSDKVTKPNGLPAQKAQGIGLRQVKTLERGILHCLQWRGKTAEGDEGQEAGFEAEADTP